MESKVAIETARAEIDRDRADHPDCVKTGESIEVFRCQKHQDWKGNSRDQRKLRNAVTIQSCELLWHLAVLRHHEHHTNQGHDCRVHCAEKQKTENNSNHNSERHSKPGRNSNRAIMLCEKPKHVLFVIGQLWPEEFRQRKHCPTEQRSAEH